MSGVQCLEVDFHAQPGTIQVTARAYNHLRERYELRPCGTIDVKGKGRMSPYLLTGPRKEQHVPQQARPVEIPDQGNKEVVGT